MKLFSIEYHNGRGSKPGYVVALDMDDALKSLPKGVREIREFSEGEVSIGVRAQIGQIAIAARKEIDS